jgi:hypothetical protein
LPGVLSVKSGFHNGREVNTVLYHADRIGPRDMIDALKRAGTFAGVAMEAKDVSKD